MKIKLTPFLLLCIMGGLAIFSSAMSKSPVLPLFIRALDASLGTVGFIAAIVFSLASLFLYLLVTQPWHLVLVCIYHGFTTASLFLGLRCARYPGVKVQPTMIVNRKNQSN